MRGKGAGIATGVIALAVCLALCVTATYAWYTLEISEEYILDVDADGFLFVYLEVPVDAMGDEDRYLFPAVAMPHAVANGMYMDALTVYDEADENPSYVVKAANVKTFNGEFTLLQSENLTSRIGYSLSVKSSPGEEALTYGKTEFGFAEVAFKSFKRVTTGNETDGWSVEIVEYNPLEQEGASQSADKTSGVLVIEGEQHIFITVTMYLANVDELMDEYLAAQTSVWCELAFAVISSEETGS